MILGEHWELGHQTNGLSDSIVILKVLSYFQNQLYLRFYTRDMNFQPFLCIKGGALFVLVDFFYIQQICKGVTENPS